ncbi:MAG TPA: HepT-like ribonuclease domain-containing protein [Longimicrobiales bacterium]|nr:HepT-like ribonuclease domain-containing protein [Longimicrobiales bacterium]
MVLDRRTVERRLRELDEVLAALGSQEGEGLEAEDLEGDLSRRWRLERGLLAAANLILDVANHIAAAHYAAHPATYEQTLRELAARGVLEEATYAGLRGLGGFRNVLAHEYLDIDLGELVRWRTRLLRKGSSLIAELEGWMDDLEGARNGEA